MDQSQQVFSYVEESNDFFLKLWSHRYDYIWAEHPVPNERPKWRTESKHPLSDRLLIQGAYLYGVRFGSTTNYILLDIDRNSFYHPAQDPQAISRIREALEELGLVSGITCTSSYSGGLHLYFPFEEVQKTWKIALAIATILENRGFKQAPGHLEIYPNPRNIASKGDIALYRGHRLPLQTGSYMLNERYEPISSSKSWFVKLWIRSQSKNDINSDILRWLLKTSRHREYRVTTKAEKFLNDLNAEIERGWTGPGMTNRLLGRIAMRSYIFGHILASTQPLQGETLIQNIVQTARNLPGFYEWSNHVHEIDKKAQDWAKAIEQTERYYPYGIGKIEKPYRDANTLTYHEQLAIAAREKIRLAIAELLNGGHLPMKVGERFKLLTNRFHIGGATLYKHKDLWHPSYLTEDMEMEEDSDDVFINAQPVEIPPDPPNLNKTSELACSEGAASSESSPSLLVRKFSKGSASKELEAPQPDVCEEKVCNKAEVSVNRNQFLLDIKRAIAMAHASTQQSQIVRRSACVEHQRQQREVAQKTYRERMKQYLVSGDPILMDEALNWLQSCSDHAERESVLPCT